MNIVSNKNKYFFHCHTCISQLQMQSLWIKSQLNALLKTLENYFYLFFSCSEYAWSILINVILFHGRSLFNLSSNILNYVQ